MWLQKVKKMYPPFLGEGGSDHTDTTLSGGGDSPKEAIEKFQSAKLKTVEVIGQKQK